MVRWTIQVVLLAGIVGPAFARPEREASPATVPQLEHAGFFFAGLRDVLPVKGWSFEPADIEPDRYWTLFSFADQETKDRLRAALADVIAIDGYLKDGNEIRGINISVYLIRDNKSPAEFFDGFVDAANQAKKKAKDLVGLETTSYIEIEGLPVDRAMTRMIMVRDRKIRAILCLRGRAVYSISTDGWVLEPEERARLVQFLNGRLDAQGAKEPAEDADPPPEDESAPATP